MDGGGAFNDEAEVNVELEFSAARVMRFAANAASNGRVLWPEYESLRPFVGNQIPPYMSNFNLTSSCALRAAMCCFVEDRMDGVLAENRVACHHDIADSRQSSNLNKGWGMYDSSTTAYCTAIAWGAEGSTSEQYKGNALFDIPFGTLLREGYVKNIGGAPMCGCVENMPVVSKTDCRELTVSNEEFTITITSAGALDIIQLEVVVAYKPCVESTFIDHYANLASQPEIDKMKTRVVGEDCKPSNDALLNGRFLVTSSKASNHFAYPSEALWQQVAGAGLSYYPVTNLDLTVRDAEFRALFAASPNKIIYRYCEMCNEQHQHIFYRRLTAVPGPETLNFLDLFLNNWVSKQNTLGVDFDLYSTYADALAQTNKWLFCNYDSPRVGFPRDCGRTLQSNCQWNSFTQGVCGGDYAPTSLGFYVEKPGAEAA
jgi:hypothetical protein